MEPVAGTSEAVLDEVILNGAQLLLQPSCGLLHRLRGGPTASLGPPHSPHLLTDATKLDHGVVGLRKAVPDANQEIKLGLQVLLRGGHPRVP